MYKRTNIKMRTLLIAALLLALLFVAIFFSLQTPSLNRIWDEDVAILAGVEMQDEESITLNQIRDWHYIENSITEKSYFNATFDPNDILAMWMYEQQLDNSGLIAHTFVVFEFDDSYGRAKYLGLSVETRREQGETYSLMGGMLRQFEITHVWATERDLVTRRVQLLDYPLTRYRLEIPTAYRAQIFRQFAKETRDLASRPQWYNTVSNNCTSSLIKYVNENEPDAIPLHYSYVLTGKVDEYLEKLGYRNAGYASDITRSFLAANPLR